MSVIIEMKVLDALVSLMDEPNENVYGEIRRKVISYGKQAIPVLEEAWVNTLGEDNSIRIEGVIDEIRQENLMFDLTTWANDSANDLLKGLYIITRYFQPELDEDYYISKFERIVRETWLELNNSLTGLEKVKVINHVLFKVYKFKSESSGIANSETYLINKILDTKKTNSVSMAVLYIAVAQHLKMPVFGINLPGHFVLVYMDEQGEIRFPNEYDESEVLFYINADNDGSVFTRNEIKHYIARLKITSRPEFFMPCNNITIIKRVISEMIISLEVENSHSKTIALTKLLSSLNEQE